MSISLRRPLPSSAIENLPALRSISEGVMLTVRLTPKSARDEIVGIETFGEETVLKARVLSLIHI